MNRWRAFLETVHLTVLGLWAGTLLAVGASAAFVFRVARALDPELPGYPALRDQHWRIVGGHVNNALFAVADTVQFGAAFLAVLTLAGAVLFAGVPARRPATVVRAFSLSLALACAAALILIVTPSMNAAFGASWAATRAGDAELALRHRADGDELHPIASRLYVAAFAFVLVSFVTAAWSNARPRRSSDAVPAGDAAPRYQEPALLRGARP